VHWRNIAIKACEQCGRQVPPLVNFQQGIVAALAEPVQRDMKILLDSEGDRLRSGSVSRDTDDSIAILVGPEGGLSDAETKSVKNAGFVATRIGPRVLRTETAAATALAILQYNYGDI
jgi:16S rRNA (uracil1498-N3)-methyltransferase